MADHRAIEGVTEALVHLLRLNYDSAYFDGHGLQVQAYVAQNFTQPMSAGVSLFLYRVGIDGAHRIPAGRMMADGRRHPPRLPLNLRYLLTIWAQDASLQHRVLAWAMRTFEDTPVLPFGLLDAALPGAFRPDETVEVIPDDLANEDLFRIWETLGQNLAYRVSVPYLARNVRVESPEAMPTLGPDMQERLLRFEPQPAPAGA
jgi:hypothetical protein